MNIEITIKNYRCFADTNPVRIQLKNGFTSFVGVNNAGKSAFLKFFYELRHLFEEVSKSDGQFVDTLTQGGRTFLLQPGRESQEFFFDGNDRPLTIQFARLNEQDEPDLDVHPAISKIVISVSRNNLWKTEVIEVEGKEFAGKIVHGDPLGIKSKTLLTEDQQVNLDPFFELFRTLANMLYIGPFRNAINVTPPQDYFDVKVGQAFINRWREAQTGDDKRLNEVIVRITQDIKRIFEFGALNINASLDGTDLQVVVEDKSYRLSELGSGLAQFIVVLGNAALRQPSFILIDEPELNLHPKLQFDFLTTLASYAKYGIIFSTHSIGLARTSSEQIYTLHKLPDGNREVNKLDANPRLSEFLGELSFSGYRELGFDRLLLVEGPTETKTMQQFLRKLKKDHKVLIMPLGGNSLINGTFTTEAQLEEIKRITTNVFVLIDSERKDETEPIPPHRVAFQSLCQNAEFQCHILELKAIENYFTKRAIQSVYGPKYSALEPYQTLETASFGWAKADNWRIAEAMTEAELKNTGDLWTFLESI